MLRFLTIGWLIVVAAAALSPQAIAQAPATHAAKGPSAARSGLSPADWHVPPPFDEIPDDASKLKEWSAGCEKTFQSWTEKTKAGLTEAQAQASLGGLVTFWTGRVPPFARPSGTGPDRKLGEGETAELLALLQRTRDLVKAHAAPDPKTVAEEKAAWEKLGDRQKATLQTIFRLRPWLDKLSPAEKLALYRIPEGILRLVLSTRELPPVAWAAFLRTQDYSVLARAILDLPEPPSHYLKDMEKILGDDFGARPPVSLSSSPRHAARVWIDQQLAHLRGEEAQKKAPPGLRSVLEVTEAILDRQWLEQMAKDFGDTGIEDVSYATLKGYFGHLDPTLHEALVRLWQVMKHSPRGKAEFTDFLKSMPKRTATDPTCLCEQTRWQDLKTKEESGTEGQPYTEALKQHPYCERFARFLTQKAALAELKIEDFILPQSRHALCLLPEIARMSDAYDSRFGELISSGTVFEKAGLTVSMSAATRSARREAVIARMLEKARLAKTAPEKNGLPPDPLANDPWLDAQIEAIARQQLAARLHATFPGVPQGVLSQGSLEERHAALTEASTKLAARMKLELPQEIRDVMRELRNEAIRRLAGEIHAKESSDKSQPSTPTEILRRVRGDPRLFALIAGDPTLRAQVNGSLKSAREDFKEAAKADPKETLYADLAKVENEPMLRLHLMRQHILGEHDKGVPTAVDPIEGRKEGDHGKIGQYVFEASLEKFLRENVQACVEKIESPRDAARLEALAEEKEREARRILHAGESPAKAAELWRQARSLRGTIDARFRLPRSTASPSSDALYTAHEKSRLIAVEIEKLNIEMKRKTAGFDRAISDLMTAARTLGYDTDHSGILHGLRTSLSQLMSQKGKLGEASHYYLTAKKQLEDRIESVIAQRKALVGEYEPMPQGPDGKTLPTDMPEPGPCNVLPGRGEKGGKLAEIEHACQTFAEQSSKLLDGKLKQFQDASKTVTAQTKVAEDLQKQTLSLQYQLWARACLGSLDAKTFPPGLDPSRKEDLDQVASALRLYEQRRHEAKRVVEAAQEAVDAEPDWNHPLLKERLATLRDEMVSGKNPFRMSPAQWDTMLAQMKRDAKESKDAAVSRRNALVAKLAPYGITWDGLRVDFRKAQLDKLNGNDEKERIANMAALKDTLVRLHEFGDYPRLGTNPWLELKRYLVERLHWGGNIPRYAFADSSLKGRNEDGNYQNRGALVEMIDEHGKIDDTAKGPTSFEKAWDGPDDYRFVRFVSLSSHLEKMDRVMKDIEGHDTPPSYLILPPEKRGELLKLERRHAAGETLAPHEAETRKALRAEREKLESRYFCLARLKRDLHEIRVDEKKRDEFKRACGLLAKDGKQFTAQEEKERLTGTSLSDGDDDELRRFEDRQKSAGLAGDLMEAQKKAIEDANRLWRGIGPAPSQAAHDALMASVKEKAEALNRKISELVALSGNFTYDPGAPPLSGLGVGSFLALQRRLAHEYQTLPALKEFDERVGAAIQARGAFATELLLTELQVLPLKGLGRLAQGTRWARAAGVALEIGKAYRNGVRISTLTKLATEELFGLPPQDFEQFVHQARHMGKLMALTVPVSMAGGEAVKLIPAIGPPRFALGTWARRLGDYVIVPGGSMAGVSAFLDALEKKSAHHITLDAGRMFIFGVDWTGIFLGSALRGTGRLGEQLSAHPVAVGGAGFVTSWATMAGLNGLLSWWDYDTDPETRHALRDQGITSGAGAALHGMKQSFIMDLGAATHGIHRGQTVAIRYGLLKGTLKYADVVRTYGIDHVREAIGQIRVGDLGDLATRLHERYGTTALENGTTQPSQAEGATYQEQIANHEKARSQYELLKAALETAGLESGHDFFRIMLRSRLERESWLSTNRFTRFLPSALRRAILDSPQSLHIGELAPALMRAKRESLVDDYLTRTAAHPDPRGGNNADELLALLARPAFSYLDEHGQRRFHDGALEALTTDAIQRAGIPHLMSSPDAAHMAVARALFARLAETHGMPEEYVQRFLERARLKKGETVSTALFGYHPSDPNRAWRLLRDGTLTMAQATTTRGPLFAPGVVDSALAGRTLGEIAALINTRAANPHFDFILAAMAQRCGFTAGDTPRFRQAVLDYLARDHGTTNPRELRLGGDAPGSGGSTVSVAEALRTQAGVTP